MILEHDSRDYRLQITANGKLILTKPGGRAQRTARASPGVDAPPCRPRFVKKNAGGGGPRGR